MSQAFDPNAILFIHQAHPSMRRRRYLRRLQAWMRARTVDRIMSGLSGAGNQRNTTIGQLYRRA